MADQTGRSGGDDHVQRFKQKLGIFMCVIYALVYASFVAVSIYDVSLMDTVMPLGLNLAAFYGIGLIVFALALAMVYSRACTFSEEKARQQSENGSSTSARKGASG